MEFSELTPTENKMPKIDINKANSILEDIKSTFDLDEFARHVQLPKKQALAEFETSIGEAKQTVELLCRFDLPEAARLLEVGAGLGLASVVMSALGFRVLALEPGGIGFESNMAASSYTSMTNITRIEVVSDTAEEVDFPHGTQFDVIYSNNVLEHVGNFDRAIKNLLPFLADHGVMIHSCPNYQFPFEPHFGLPLLPLAPRLTQVVLPRSIRESGLWRSLNFVTVRTVRRSLQGSNYEVRFKRGTMLKSFSRLRTDGEFAKRHAFLAGMAANKVVYGLMKRLLTLPVGLATPMDFIIYRKPLASDPRIVDWVRS